MSTSLIILTLNEIDGIRKILHSGLLVGNKKYEYVDTLLNKIKVNLITYLNNLEKFYLRLKKSGLMKYL